MGYSNARLAKKMSCAIGILVFAGELQPAAGKAQSEFAVASQIDPAHSGSMTFRAGFSLPLQKLWTRTIGNQDDPITYPLIADGKVIFNQYINGQADGLTYALDLARGTTVWSEENSDTYIGPAYDNGTVFIATTDGFLYARSAKTGKLKWSLELPDDEGYPPSAPTAVNGQVYIQGGTGYVYDVDEKSGNVVWREGSSNGDGDSSPAYGDNGVYISNLCYYYKFDAVTGNLDWQAGRGCDAGGGATPTCFSERVYIEDWVDGNSTLDATTGNRLGTFIGPPAFRDGKTQLGFSVSNYRLYAWNVSTGATVWTFKMGTDLATSPIVVNGLVFVGGSNSGTVYALDAGTGRLKWSDTPGQSVTGLSAGQGVLIVVSYNNITAYASQ